MRQMTQEKTKENVGKKIEKFVQFDTVVWAHSIAANWLDQAMYHTIVFDLVLSAAYRCGAVLLTAKCVFVFVLLLIMILIKFESQRFGS